VPFWDETAWRRRLPGYIALSPPLLLFRQVREHLYRNLPVPQFPFVDNPLLGADFWTARMTAIKVLGKYLLLLVFPRGLPVWRIRAWCFCLSKSSRTSRRIN
jgi:hypothetical protein